MTSLLGFSLAPQLALTAGIVAALLTGLMTSASRLWLRLVAVSVVAAALVLTALSSPVAEGTLLRLDSLGLSWQFLFYLGALPLAFLLDLDDEVPLALFLGSALGMGLLAAANSLLMLFVSLEFMSIPAYILVSRSGKGSQRAREGAVKYFFAGSTAGSLFLFGMALYYADARSLALAPASGPLAQAGLAFMGAAALFKVGAVPLHFWLPDAYEAASPELAGFLSTSMKSAAVLLLMRLVSLAPQSALAHALPAVGALTMLGGSLIALRQQRLQRLLAYSSVSHVGYLILGVGAWAAQGATAQGAYALLFYLGAYVFMSNGAFCFLRASGLTTRSELRGYGHRDPRVAALFVALLLSLGGVPPTAGFLAKLLILWEAVRASLFWPAAVGGLAALISLGYYLGLVRDAYFESGDVPASGEINRAHEPKERLVLLICAIPAALLGLAPWIVGVLSGVLAQ